jgi:hypothetical protein
VNLNLRSPVGTLVKSWTLSNASDVISTIGGNRYIWFVHQDIEGLAIDNVVRVGGQVCGNYSCNLYGARKGRSCLAVGSLSSDRPQTIAVRCSNGASMQDVDATVTSGASSVNVLGDNGTDQALLTMALPDSESGAGNSSLETSIISGRFEGMCTITQPAKR